MGRRLGCFLWWLMVLSCHAAEIVAWKVPLSRFSHERGLDAIGIVRCKAAPEASPFFRQGDQLWDLKGIPVDQRIETEPPLEWVVWNESSGRLVAKADWNGIWQLNQRLGMDRLPQQCRLTAEVFEVQADGSPFSEKSLPLMVLSWVSRSGQEGEAIHQQDGRMIRAKGTATIVDGDSLVDMRIEVSVTLRAAEPDPKEVPKPHPFKEVMVPEILRPWFDRPVWDLRGLTRDQGLDLKDGADFVEYDPLTQRIFIFSNSLILLDWIEQLYNIFCCGRSALLVATFDSNGQTRLVTHSGQRCHVKRTMAGDKETLLLEIKPTIGEMNELIDLRLCYRDESMAQRKQSINTAVTLSTGRTLELISGGAGDANKSSLSVKAEVIQVP